MDATLPDAVSGQAVAGPGSRRSALINRYLLRLLSRPLLATLSVVLPALLLERLLRLFDLVANGNGTVAPIVRLLLYLTPHYVGLALPAAFFISIFLVIARLGENHELDALQGSGMSLARLSRPFVLVGLFFALLGVGIYGYLQPLGRYQYRSAFYSVTHAGWNASVTPGEFIRIGSHLTVTADSVDRAAGRISGIFIEQRRPDGTEVTTTARSGWLNPPNAEGRLVLELNGGTQISVAPDSAVTVLDFGASTLSQPFSLELPPFRPRGEDEREMTLDELWTRTGQPPEEGPDAIPRRRMESELHGRLVRSLSLALLPLLAIPMGLGAKRTRRWHGVVLSALILVLYHHAVQLAESLGDIGVINPRPALWGAFAAFGVFCLLTFRKAQRNPNEGPFDGMLGWLDELAGPFRALLPRRKRRAT